MTEEKSFKERVQTQAVKVLLHPTTRKITDFCSTAADIVGDLQRFQNPIGIVLGAGAFLEAWATRVSPSGNGPALGYLVDILELAPAQHLPITRFMSAAKIRSLPGLKEVSRDKLWTAFEFNCPLGKMWFGLSTVSKQEEQALVNSAAGNSLAAQSDNVQVYVHPDMSFETQMAISKEILRGSLIDAKGRKSRLLEVVEGGSGRLNLSPVTMDLTHTDFDKVVEMAEDIAAKRREGRSPAYIFDGPGGTGKTTFAMAVGELMGGMTLIMGPSALGNNTLAVIVDSLSPDIVIIDDFDKTSNSVRNQFYTSMLTLRNNHKNTTWFLTTNNAPALGAPLLRPGRGGVLRPFRAPGKEERVHILTHNGLDQAMAEQIATALPAGMTHDWIVYLAQEIKQKPKKAVELVRDWRVNWGIANGAGAAVMEEFEQHATEATGVFGGIASLVQRLEAGGFSARAAPPLEVFDDEDDGDIPLVDSPHSEHEYNDEFYCLRLGCEAWGPADGHGPCFGV